MRTRKPLALAAAPERAASAAAATVAIGAVACGVCCVLPFALPAVALAASGGTLAAFAQAFWGALYFATAMVAIAWLWVIVDTRRTEKRPARATLTMMVVATAALAVAGLWPTIEPHLITMLKAVSR